MGVWTKTTTGYMRTKVCSCYSGTALEVQRQCCPYPSAKTFQIKVKSTYFNLKLNSGLRNKPDYDRWSVASTAKKTQNTSLSGIILMSIGTWVMHVGSELLISLSLLFLLSFGCLSCSLINRLWALPSNHRVTYVPCWILLGSSFSWAGKSRNFYR